MVGQSREQNKTQKLFLYIEFWKVKRDIRKLKNEANHASKKRTSASFIFCKASKVFT